MLWHDASRWQLPFLSMTTLQSDAQLMQSYRRLGSILDVHSDALVIKDVALWRQSNFLKTRFLSSIEDDKLCEGKNSVHFSWVRKGLNKCEDYNLNFSWSHLQALASHWHSGCFRGPHKYSESPNKIDSWFFTEAHSSPMTYVQGYFNDRSLSMTLES